MSTDLQTELHALAQTAANEIYQGFRSYDGKKWETTNGRERAVTFNVEAPSLKGKTVRELNPEAFDRTGNFNSRLWSAGGKYVNGHLRGRTLSTIHYTPEIFDDVYTGVVAVSERH